MLKIKVFGFSNLSCSALCGDGRIWEAKGRWCFKELSVAGVPACRQNATPPQHTHQGLSWEPLQRCPGGSRIRDEPRHFTDEISLRTGQGMRFPKVTFGLLARPCPHTPRQELVSLGCAQVAPGTRQTSAWVGKGRASFPWGPSPIYCAC